MSHGVKIFLATAIALTLLWAFAIVVTFTHVYTATSGTAMLTVPPCAEVVPCDWQADGNPSHLYKPGQLWQVYFRGSVTDAATWQRRHASWCTETIYGNNPF